VPTKFVYSPNGTVAKWGFLCEDEDGEDMDEIQEMFKVYLDQEAVDEARRKGLRDIPSVEDTKRLVTDYLRAIYAHVKRSIEANTGSWMDMKVEFIFSMPTTWQSLGTTVDFEKAIRAAGFGEENTSRHTARLELTEAEAAAVYVAGNPQVRFAAGDILLVCDAGGGTTDLGLIEVVDSDPHLSSLKQVNAVKGVGIGSTMIDRAFQQLVQRRLDNHPDAQVVLPRNLAFKLSRSTAFRSIKHKFGTGSGDQPEYKLALDRLGLGINQEFSHPGLRVERGRMIFSRAEIQSLFDNQIRGIVRRIDEQLAWMSTNRNHQFVRYLVLSGGLGGSPYVKTQLDAQYAQTRMAIIRSQEPRLSVVKGLVMDRRQRLVTGTAALKTRIARASYGVLCRQIYNPNYHIGADVDYDVYNKSQKWALYQIEWLIRKVHGSFSNQLDPSHHQHPKPTN
jgi:hypothetical protein